MHAVNLCQVPVRLRPSGDGKGFYGRAPPSPPPLAFAASEIRSPLLLSSCHHLDKLQTMSATSVSLDDFDKTFGKLIGEQHRPTTAPLSSSTKLIICLSPLVCSTYLSQSFPVKPSEEPSAPSRMTSSPLLTVCFVYQCVLAPPSLCLAGAARRPRNQSQLLTTLFDLTRQPSVSMKGQFGPNGALFDGWESRRHNPRYDW